MAYNISKKNVVMQVQHTHVIKGTVARLQLHTDIYYNIFCISC